MAGSAETITSTTCSPSTVNTDDNLILTRNNCSMVDNASTTLNKTPSGLDDKITPDDWSRARRALSFFTKNPVYGGMSTDEMLYTALLGAYNARQRCTNPKTLDYFATTKAKFAVIDELRRTGPYYKDYLAKIKQLTEDRVSFVHQNCSHEVIDEILAEKGHVTDARHEHYKIDARYVISTAERILSRVQLERVVLHYVYGWTYSEIAVKQKVSLSAVQMGVEVSINKLKKFFE